MTLQYLPYIVTLIVATVTAALVAMYAWRRRATPGGIYFALMMAMAAEWSFAYAGELAFVEISAKTVWGKLAYPAVVSLPPLWLLFALRYGHYTRWITPRRIALLWIVPVCVLGLTLTNEWHGLVWPHITPIAEVPGAIFHHGIVVWIDVAYSYTLLLIGTILFVQTTLRSDPLYRKQIGALLVGAAIPWVANALYIMGVTPLRGLDATPVAFTLTGLIFAWGIFRFHTLDIVPIARDALIEIMSDAVLVLDTYNRIVDINPAARQLIGNQAGRVIGQQAETLLAQWPDLIAIHQRVLEGEAEIALEAGGASRWMDIRISPLYDHRQQLSGRLVVVRDITAHKQSEMATQEQRRLAEVLRDTIAALSSTLDLDAVMNCILDNLGRVVSHDAASIILIEGDTARFACWRGYSPETEAFFRQYRLPSDSFAHEVARSGMPRLAVTADSELAWVKSAALTWVRSYVYVPIRASERIIGVLNVDSATPGFFTTTHVEQLQTFASQAAIAIANAQLHAQIRLHAEELEQRVVERTAELTEANTRLLELDQLKTRFINDMSHELRTPITSIGMGLYLLKHDKLERMTAHLEGLESQFARLKDLLDQTLSFAYLHQTGPRSEASVPIDLNDTIGDVISMCSSRAQAAGLALTFTPCTDLLTVRGYPDELTQAITHLVINAIIYTPEGQVTVRTYRDGEYACLEIQDTGIGIPSSDLPHLFTAFYRGEQVGSSNIPGMGLGLSIVKEILDRHNSQIIVRSGVGIGTTLTVRLALT